MRTGGPTLWKPPMIWEFGGLWINASYHIIGAQHNVHPCCPFSSFSCTIIEGQTSCSTPKLSVMLIRSHEQFPSQILSPFFSYDLPIWAMWSSKQAMFSSQFTRHVAPWKTAWVRNGLPSSWMVTGSTTLIKDITTPQNHQSQQSHHQLVSIKCIPISSCLKP